MTALRAVHGRATFLQKDYPRARALLEEALAKITSGRHGDPPVRMALCDAIWPARERSSASSMASGSCFTRGRSRTTPSIDLPHCSFWVWLSASRGRDDEAAGRVGAAEEAAKAAGRRGDGRGCDAPRSCELHSPAFHHHRLRHPTGAAADPRLPPPRASAHSLRVLLGELAGAQGDRAEADYWVETALAFDLEPELRARAQLVAATAALEAGDTDKASRLAQQVVDATGPWSGRADRILEEILGN